MSVESLQARASLFVSGRKYFILRVELTETRDVTYYMALESLHLQSWEFFPRQIRRIPNTNFKEISLPRLSSFGIPSMKNNF